MKCRNISCCAIVLCIYIPLMGQWSAPFGNPGSTTTHVGIATLNAEIPTLTLETLGLNMQSSSLEFWPASQIIKYNHYSRRLIMESKSNFNRIHIVYDFDLPSITLNPSNQIFDAALKLKYNESGDDYKSLVFDQNEISSIEELENGTYVGQRLDLNPRGGDVSIGRSDVYYNATAQKLGIGTTSPTHYKLHIAGRNDALKIDASIPSIRFVNDSLSQGSIYSASGNMYYRNELTDGASHLGSTGKPLTIDEVGYVGLNTKAPESPLHIKQAATEILRLEKIGNDYGYLSFYNAGIRKAYLVKTAESMYYINEGENDTFFGNDGLPQFVLNSNGNIGIGNYNPNYALDVNGNGNFTGELTAASDRKLKKNITQLSTASVHLMQLKPVRYYFRVDEYPLLGLSKNQRHGLIAQEVEEVIPGLVSNKAQLENAQGQLETYKTLNYIDLIPWLIKGLQEQNEELSQLRKAIASTSRG